MNLGTPSSWRRRTAMIAVAGLAATMLGALSISPAQAVGDNSLISWGFNNQGQLGDGSTTANNLPAEVGLPAGVTVTKVEAAAQASSFAITSDGKLLAWGNNNQGQLGDGTHTDRHTPVSVDLSILNPGEKIIDVASGQDHTVAVTSEGRGLAWGNNFWGNLGDGTTTNTDTPVLIEQPGGVKYVGITAGYDHSVAVTDDGKLLAWGYGGVGNLGNGGTATQHDPTPVDLSVLDAGETIVDVASMTHHNLALTSNGRVIGWGDNQYGQIGDETTTQRRTPVLAHIPSGTTISSIGVGWDHSLVVTSAGDGLGWGSDRYGQVGDGGTTPAVHPEISSIDLPAGVKIKDVDGGIDHSVALTTDGRVLAFGYGGSGQMGDGTNTVVNPSPVFSTLPAFSKVKDIDVGVYHNLAVADLNSTPTVTIASPVDGATVEYGSTIAADFACDDAEGLDSCVGTVADGANIDTTSGLGAKSFKVTATDTAGEVVSKTVGYTVVDTTNPAVTVTTPPTGATYIVGDNVNADYECTDLLLDTCVGNVADGAAIDTATRGSKTFTVTGTDTSGNQTVVENTYSVNDTTVIKAQPAVANILPNLPNVLVLVPLKFEGKLTTTAGAPLAGQTLTFTSGGGGCAAVTDANGVAKCGTVIKSVFSVLSLGYNVKFAGGSYLEPSTGRGGFVNILGIRIL